MRHLLFISVLFIGACSVPPKPLEPSVQMLNTNKTPQELIPDLKKVLTENKYAVANENPNVGLLSLKPRGFKVNTATGELKAKQVVQMRQEGGSLKMRITYVCNYAGEQFEKCNDSSPEIISKIQRLDVLLKNIVSKQLIKERERAKSTSIGEIDPDEK